MAGYGVIGSMSRDISARCLETSQTCPGPGTVYLGRTFESPELVFVRSLEVDA
jgi:hypothetical protein